MHPKLKRVHMVGIGGIGMCGIAEVLHNLGYQVTGSDLKDSPIVRRLRGLGIPIQIGHTEKNVNGAQVVVYSSAVSDQNLEIKAARSAMIPVIKRAEMLAELMRIKYGIAIAGSHGKTTTTSMAASILARGGLDPTIVIGGRLDSIGSTAKLGQGEYLVAEADESDGSFLRLSPTIAVVTNIDAEHLDFYKDIGNIKDAFLKFVERVPFYGLICMCPDQKIIQELIPKVTKRCLTYGLRSQCDLQAKDIWTEGMNSRFDAVYQGEDLGPVELSVPGIHNIYNALAAILVAIDLEIPFLVIQMALKFFNGPDRRFQVKARIGDLMVVDDYGHHPTEIKATLKAAKKGWGKRVICVFQPHRYTRTRFLLEDFATSFYDADTVVVTDIYPAGEKPMPGVDAGLIFEALKGHGHRDVHYIPDVEEIPGFLKDITGPGDMVLTLGAGDIWKVGERFAEELKKGQCDQKG
ncbi:UDP-N-acetylmuramate--L-alanine ligase [bacterium]|nr:UDP-N-acetylmuramate--L-alanine ligase [bacterium]